MGWNGVGSIWRTILHSGTNLSRRGANICYFRGGVNFLSVLFLEGSLVKTLLAHICSFSPSSELEEEIDLLSLLSLLFLKKNLHLTLLLP